MNHSSIRRLALAPLIIFAALFSGGCMQRVTVAIPHSAEQIDLVASGYTAIAVVAYGGRFYRDWEGALVDAFMRSGVPVIESRAISHRLHVGDQIALVRYSMDGHWITSQASPVLSGRIWAIDAVAGDVLANHVVALRLHEADLSHMRYALRDHPRIRFIRDDAQALARTFAVEQAVAQMATRFERRDVFFRRTSDPRYDLALAHARAGEWLEAVPLFEVMAKENPDDRHLARNLRTARSVETLLGSPRRQTP